MTPDPLCDGTEHGIAREPKGCACKRLTLARLQGPVKAKPHHAPFCWCPRCWEATA